MLAALLLASVLGGPPGPADDPLAPCEKKLAEDPVGRHGYACLQYYARSAELQRRAILRLDAALASHKDLAWAQLALGSLTGGRDEPRAEPLLRAAAKNLAQLNAPDAEAIAYLNLSNYLRNRGRLDEAKQMLGLAQDAADRSGNEQRKIAVLTERGRFALIHDVDPHEAELLLRQADQALGPPGKALDPLRIKVRNALAIVASKWGRDREAIGMWEALAEELHAAGDTYGEANVRLAQFNTRVVMRDENGDLPTAEDIAHAYEMLELATISGNTRVERVARGFVADLETWPKAEALFAQAIELADEAGDVRNAVQPRIHWARKIVGNAPEELDQARKHLDLARRRIESARLDDMEMLHAEVAAIVAWADGERSDAIETSRRTLHLIESNSSRYSQEDTRTVVFSISHGSYELFVGHLLGGTLGEPTDQDIRTAFETMERKRARALLQRLRDSAVHEDLAANDELFAERKQALATIAATQRSLLDPDLSADRRSQLYARLDRAEAAFGSSELRLAQASPRYRQVADPDLVSLEDVQATLSETEAVIAFQAGRQRDHFGVHMGGSWALAIWRDGFAYAPMPDIAQLAADIEFWTGMINRRDGSDREAAAALYRATVHDILKALPKQVAQLVLLPDGPLHQLPFGALRSAPDSPPLASTFEISRSPSATLWLRWRRPNATVPNDTVLAFADPTLSFHTTPAVERGWSPGTLALLGPLPRARDEVAALAQRVPDVVTRIGADATEAGLKRSNLDRIGILHLATHAVVDDRKPGRSALLFGPGDDDEDGLLQFREIAKLSLSGRMVVLSACRSASGRVRGGEGPMSIARAFFAAGARVIVASLWPLRDDDALLLFEKFYAYLDQGHPVRLAMVSAQRDRIAEGAPPAAWAGAVVLGDGDHVPLPRPQRSEPLMLVTFGLAVVFGAATTFVWRRRRRNR